MEHQDYTDIIEAYLDNSLPESKRIEVEQLMETDNDFRQEVQLLKHLRVHLSDPERWKHYDALSEAMQDPYPPADKPPPAPPVNKNRLWKWVGLLAVLLTVGFLVWKQSWTEAPLPTPTPTVPPPVNEPIAQTSKPMPETKPVAPAEKKPTPSSTAQADLADFIPHKTGEANVAGTRSGTGSIDSVDMSSPKNSDDFIPDRNRTTKVTFKGAIVGASEKQSFVLLIYDNHDMRKALLSIALETSKDASGNMAFDSRQSLNLKRGLYYFTVVEKETEVELYTGKFTIGKP